MEKLTNHTLIYDSDCPMCDLYTKGFISAGMLDQNGRIEYGCARVPVTFDNVRARNEIALVDYTNGTVTYGIDSLFKVIGHSFPALKPIFNCPVFRFPISMFYKFISYNRKIIAPPPVFEKRGSCTPSYNVRYRVAYIVFAWLISSLILSAYTPSLQPFVPHNDFFREFMIGGGQIFFQVVFVRFMTKDRLLHYIGNMMTVSLMGSLLLLPMLIIIKAVPISLPWFPLVWFTSVVSFMLFAHWRRVKWLGISWLATVTWVVYRVLILWIVAV